MIYTTPPDEQLELEIERASAKSRMKETYETISKLKHMLEVFNADYMKWLNKYKRADLALAEHDGRLKKLKGVGERKPTVSTQLDFTKEQIISIAKALGQDIKFTDEGGEVIGNT